MTGTGHRERRPDDLLIRGSSERPEEFVVGREVTHGTAGRAIEQAVVSVQRIIGTRRNCVRVTSPSKVPLVSTTGNDDRRRLLTPSSINWSRVTQVGTVSGLEGIGRAPANHVTLRSCPRAGLGAGGRDQDATDHGQQTH